MQQLPRDLDYVFHLACFHGNQSSIADPIADHDNNAITSLKLFDQLKSFSSLKKVVYAAAGCAVAEKTFGEATATKEDAPLSLYHDSPYSISKIIGELYGNYYFQRYGLPLVKTRFQNIYGPREILGAGRWRGTVHTVWRNVTPSFIWKALHGDALPLENGGMTSRDFVYVEDLVDGLQRAALRGVPGEVYNLASGVETGLVISPTSSTSSSATIGRSMSGRRGIGIIQAPASARPRNRSGCLALRRACQCEKACAGRSNGRARITIWSRAASSVISIFSTAQWLPVSWGSIHGLASADT